MRATTYCAREFEVAAGNATERWWIAYANFVTLLLALFIVLFAISKTDQEKLKQVSNSVRAAFSSSGSGSGSGSGTPPATGLDSTQESPGSPTVDETSAERAALEAKKWAREKKDLQVSLEELGAVGPDGTSQAASRIETRDGTEGLWVSFVAREFFREGSAELAEDFFPLVDRIGRVLARSRRMIRIEGHADIREVEVLGAQLPTPHFGSTWALSSARAEAVARRWIKKSEMGASRLVIAGRAEYHPQSEEDSELAHARNRRVEILVLGAAGQTIQASPTEENE